MVTHVEPGTVDYLDDLDPAVPPETGAQVSYADDNLRNIKKALTQSFTGITGAVTATHTQINNAVAGILPSLAVDTDVLVVDESNDRVGINQATPSADLHLGSDADLSTVFRIQSDNAAGTCAIKMGDVDDADICNFMYDNSIDELAVTVGATEILRLKANRFIVNDGGLETIVRIEGLGEANLFRTDPTNDRVGVKQGAPATSLHVGDEATAGETNTLTIEGGGSASSKIDFITGATTTATLQASHPSNSLVISAGGSSQFILSNSGATYNGGNADMDFDVDGDTINFVFHVDAGKDNVGIKTNNPHTSAALDVNGPIYISGVLHASDWVLELAQNNFDKLPSIEDHARQMLNDLSLPWIEDFETKDDGTQTVDFERRSSQMLAELELAHIYIAHMHDFVKTLQDRVQAIELSSIN